MAKTLLVASSDEMQALGERLVVEMALGDVVMLAGPLGAGKTTFVRGALRGLGYVGTVRSPTYNLIQTFETAPPCMHADLFRVKDYRGIGLEEYLATHLCMIEWPDRATGLIDHNQCWQITITPCDRGREVAITRPVRG